MFSPRRIPGQPFVSGRARPTRSLAAGAWPLLVIALLFGLPPSHAAAQNEPPSVSTADKAAAESLFDRGLALMREGKLEEACRRLEQSQAVEPGIGTMLYLAECYERMGRIASAWALFREAASRAEAAGQQARAEAGEQRARQLQPRLSMLTVDVPESSQVEGLEVLRNGSPVPPGLWNLEVPVDPGVHALKAHAPGHVTWRAQVRVEGDSARVQVSVPQLEPEPETETASESPSPPPAAPDKLSPSPRSRPRARWQRLAGWTVGGAGVASLLVGSAFGVRAIVKNNQADDACGGEGCTSQTGVDLSDQAMRAARIANGTLLAGGLLTAAGVVLYFTARRRVTPDTRARRPRPSVAFGRDSVGVQLGGAF